VDSRSLASAPTFTVLFLALSIRVAEGCVGRGERRCAPAPAAATRSTSIRRAEMRDVSGHRRSE
jgi:hypothetical protein